MKQKVNWILHIFERIILVAAVLLAVFPILYVLTNSFKTQATIYKMPPKLFFKPIFDNWGYILGYDNFTKYFKNTIVISLSTTIIVVFFGVLAAYGLRIFKSNLGQRISNMLLIGRIVPTITILIPLFVIYSRIGLTGSHLAVILIHSASTLPFITWLLTSFIYTIPKDLFESAKVDGCNRIGVLFTIVMPILVPVLMSAVILAMQYSWNEFMYSLAYTNLNTYTITVGVARYTGAMSINMGRVGAVASLAFIPIMIVGFALQKYFIEGMTAGAVKG